MQIIKTAIYVPVMLVGAVLFAAGTILLLLGRNIAPNSTIFDRWINHIIDGAKSEKPPTAAKDLTMHKVATV